MANLNTEGNTEHGPATETRERERLPEREHWMFRREEHSPEQERRVSMEVITSGSMVEAVGGFVAVVLSILSLANVAPVQLASIATIAVGTALLFEGGSFAMRFWSLPEEFREGHWGVTELAGGMMAEFLAGITGIVLGIFALGGHASALLMSVSILIFGLALLFGSGLTSRLNYLEMEPEEKGSIAWRLGHATTTVAVSVQILFGLTATVLGILALVGIAPLVLAEVTLLILGISVLLSGFAVAHRIMGLLRRCRC